jgi:Sortase domain
VPDRTSARSGAGWLMLAGAVVALVGRVMWWSPSPDSRAMGRPPAAAGARQPTPAGPSAPTTAGSALVRGPREAGAPRRVLIPALRVDAPVVPVRAPGGTLVPPADPQRLGWWADGVRPGARRGSVLVAGHTVHTGGGALDDLEDLQPGDAVAVRTDHGVLRYGVRRVSIHSKGSLAQHAGRLFSQRVAGRLVLVTCEDWDGVRYLSNVVVVATPQE